MLQEAILPKEGRLLNFKKLVVGVDLDSTVADLLDEWLGLYNEEYNVNYTAKEIHDWELGKCVPIGSEVYKYLDDPGLYRRLKPYSGAIEALSRIHGAGHKIHIISSPSPAEHTAADKLWWCKYHLPFLPRKQINLMHEKHHFTCDVIVDDAPHHVRDFKLHQPATKRVALAFPYNECVAEDLHLRANSFEDTENAWREIEEFINKLSRS